MLDVNVNVFRRAMLYFSSRALLYLHPAMAKAKGAVTLIISCRQSVTKYAMAASAPFHIVQAILSTTPTTFLCSMSTHSTPEKINPSSYLAHYQFKYNSIYI